MLDLTQITPFIHQLPIYLLEAEVEAKPGSVQWLLQSNVFNVILVVLMLGYFVKKMNLGETIDTKQAKMAAEIEAVERQKQEALQQLEQAKRRTANLSAEVEEILRNAKESAELMSAQIVTDARAESTKIVEHARKRVELEQRSAMRDLERRLLSDALSDARVELANSMNASDQKRSVEAFLEELSERKGAR